MRIDARKNTEAEFGNHKAGRPLCHLGRRNPDRRGGDLIIIDDPIKPMEAASETSGKRVKEWFDATVITRLDQPATGAIVVLMQRVHEDDLTGHLLEKGGWVHLAIPAIAVEATRIAIGHGKFHDRQPGDILEPNRYTLDDLNGRRRDLGSVLFEAQFQQNPMPLVAT